MKKIYHVILSVVLRLVGLDFSWYRIFYVRVIYALPVIEPILQLIRSRSCAEKVIGSEALSYIKPRDTVLDIGANVGSISSYFLTLGVTVHAFEPDSRCIALLQRRFKWFGRGRIHIHHSAISHENGEVSLHYGSITTESNSILSDKPGADGSAGGERVSAQSILDVIDQYGYVALIKMDIEGAEYDVLDVLLQPANLGKFGACLVEVHAKKIPGLMPRQRMLEERVKDLGLESRVILTWH